MASKKKFRLEAYIVLIAVLGFGGYYLWARISRLGCGDVDSAFERIAAAHASERNLGALAEHLKLGRDAVPCLLDKLGDAGEVSRIRHPGGHDRMGMPKSGRTEIIRARDLAKRVLSIILSREPHENEPEIHKALRDFLLDETTSAKLFGERVKHELFEANYQPNSAYILKAMGELRLQEAREPLLEVLDRFMQKDRDWKWIPGRTLIGATLESLAVLGDARTVARLVQHLQKPGCDFLGIEFMKCLAKIGHKNVPAVLRAIDSYFPPGVDIKTWRGEDYQAVDTLMMSLGQIQSQESIAYLKEVLELDRKEIKRKQLGMRAVDGLGNLKARGAAGLIAIEFMDGDKNTKVTAEHALYSVLAKAKVEELVPMAGSGGEDGETLAAVFGLGFLGGEQELVMLQHTRGGKRFQKMAGWAIGKLKKKVADMRKKARRERRLDVWQKLSTGKILPEQAVPEILEMMEEEPYFTDYQRSMALNYLGRAGSRKKLPGKAIEVMKTNLKKGSVYLKLSAAGALGMLGNRSGLSYVNQILTSKDRKTIMLQPRATFEYLKITGKVHPKLKHGLDNEDQNYINALIGETGLNRSRQVRKLLERLSKKARNENNATRALGLLKEWKN